MESAITRRAPPPDDELAILLVGGVAIQRLDDHLASTDEVVGLPELRDEFFEHAVVVGHVFHGLLAQGLARVALEHELHAAELVDRVELWRDLALGFLPIGAELV